MTKSDWLQCPSLYVTNMVLVTENIYEHRSKSTYAGLHVSSPYGFVVQSVFLKKKDSCLNSAGFCCCFCLFFVCWLFSQILSRETVLLEVDPPFRLNYNCTNPLVQLRLPERNNI